jgi:hypothetical protein
MKYTCLRQDRFEEGDTVIHLEPGKPYELPEGDERDRLERVGSITPAEGAAAKGGKR